MSDYENWDKKDLLRRIFELEAEKALTPSEEALRESRERYRSLAEAAQDYIFIIGRDGKIQYINSFGARQFGKLAEEMIGKDRGILFPSPVAERQELNLRKVLETGEPISVEGITTFPRGDVWLDTRLIPLKNADGSVKAVLGISRDITSRKKAEEALRESEEKFRLLTEEIDDGVVISFEGKNDWVNKSLARFTGYSYEELIGKGVDFVIAPEEVPALLERMRVRRAGGPAPSRYETIAVRGDGKRINSA